MAHRIVIDEARLRDEFEDMLDEIYFMYHYHPSSILNYAISDVEQSEMSFYDSIAPSFSQEMGTKASSKRKKVRFHNNPDYCNGLPRRRQ